MSTNDITGDAIRTRAPSKAYSDGFDRIFGKKTPIGEDTRPKDRVKLGLSPSTIVEEMESDELKKRNANTE